VLTTVPVFARKRGWVRRTALRRLLALAEKSPDGAPWLVRVGRRWLVNEEILEASAPALFKGRNLEDRVAELEAALEEHSAALAVLAPMVRDLRRNGQP